MDTLKTLLALSLILTTCTALDYRLPTTTVPTFYELSLTIDPKSTNYTGNINITLRTSTNSSEIYIHDDGDFIEIGSAILNSNAECYVGKPNKVHIVRINCTKSLIADEDNWVYLKFDGKFSMEDGFGLVRSTYKDGEDDQFMIESNFKPTFARRAFPCFDEPEFKAGFSLEVEYPSGYTAISSSPIATTEDCARDDFQKTKFETTTEISTYLLSIFISKLQEAKTTSEDKLNFKIFTRPDVTSLTNTVANKFYHKIIEKLDSYTEVPYENLSDTESYMVAVPDYSDAMGDFGLFAYRESDLLDEKESTTNQVKQNIIITMVYKLTHEWYGGDVGTKWWSDIWANEAVATYLKYIIADEVDEELELTSQFLIKVTQRNLQNDGYSFAQSLSSKEY